MIGYQPAVSLKLIARASATSIGWYASAPFQVGVRNSYENNTCLCTSCRIALCGGHRNMPRDPKAQATTSRSYGTGGHPNNVRRGR